MAIAAKPKPKNTNAQANTDEDAIKALINKGGSVAATDKDDKSTGTHKNLQLRLKPELIDQIDRIRETQDVPPSRHTWILEAIYEKLKRNT